MLKKAITGFCINWLQSASEYSLIYLKQGKDRRVITNMGHNEQLRLMREFEDTTNTSHEAIIKKDIERRCKLN